MIKSVGLIAACTFTVSQLDAQSQPFVNASAGAAYVVLQTVEDGPSMSKWDFNPVTQLRGSIDMSISENTTLGVTYGRATVPLKYSRLGLGTDPNGICPSSCDANANFQSFLGSLRVVSGEGLHQVIEANVGVNVYKNFRERASSGELHAGKPDRDVGFTLGYGFGYSATRRLSVSLLGDVGFTIHSRSGSAANLTEINTQLQARLNFRAGFGG